MWEVGGRKAGEQVREIDAAANIMVRHGTEAVGGGGEGRLTHLVLRDRGRGHTETVPAAGLFVLIGAEPHTQWLPDGVERDDAGYVLTGAATRPLPLVRPACSRPACPASSPLATSGTGR